MRKASRTRVTALAGANKPDPTATVEAACQRRPRSARRVCAVPKPITVSDPTWVAASRFADRLALTRVVAITIGGRVAPWNQFGLSTVALPDGQHGASLGDVALIIDESQPPGIRHLVLADCPHPVATVAGLAVRHANDSLGLSHVTATSTSLGGQLVVIGVDHVVVLSDDVRATCAQVERDTGAPLKRVKEGERGVQGFHRLGSVILEVVERRLVEPGRDTSGAAYWGFVIVVDDIATVATRLGPDVIGAPKRAVQDGRLISTVRSAAGLGVPLALMSR